MISKRIAIYVLGFIVLLSLGGCEYAGEPIFVGLATPTPAPPTPTPTATPVPPPFSLRETDNLLILGTDRRPDWTNWRTDSIMVVGIDHQYRRAAVLSIPRDLYVSIPGYGQGRINQVDYIGERQQEGNGPALLSRVVSETLGVSTDHWVRVEMRGFESMVDALGGVTVHLDCPFYELVYDLDLQAWTYFELPAGDVLLDGQDAHFFVTLRLIESDFGRSRRQRQFLWALRNQARDTDLILRLPELWTAFQQTFSTDLSLLEMIELARFGISMEPENVRAAALTNKELERWFTPAGADVLRIRNQAAVNALIDNIWSESSLAETGRQDPNACPPPPRGAPSYVAQQAQPAAAPAADATPVAPEAGAGVEAPAAEVPVDDTAAETPAETTDAPGVGGGGGEPASTPPEENTGQ